MSDSSENEEISSSLKKGKRKMQRIIEDSSSDSDSSIDNNHRRKRILKVSSEADSSDTDSSDVIKGTHRKKKMRVSSSTSDDSYGDSDSESDWSTNSETEEQKKSSKSRFEMNPGPSTSSASANKIDDSSSDSDGQTEKCSICFGKFLNQEIGTPETCDHSFCAYCLQEWAKNVNTCPVDRQEFSLILVRRRLNDKIIRKIPVERRRLDGDLDIIENDPTFCEICGQGDREDRMLLCDGCDLGYHMECLDPPLETVPVEEWYCAECANAGPLADSVDIHPDEINALWDEILELGGRPTRRRRAAADQAMVRLIPRTRQSERVRITIEMNRERGTANIENQLANDGPSTSSGFESIADNSNPGTLRNADNASALTQRRRKPVTTKRKKKRKTRKRKKRQVTVEYEIDESSGAKFALKKKSVGRKRKRKYRRRRKARIIEPSRKTVKKRLADQLGMCSRKQASQVIPEIKVKTSQDAIGYQRSQAGIPTLHLFGRRDELDYFSEDSDNADEASIGFGLSLATRARQQLHGLSMGRQNRLKSVLMSSPPPAATPCDILGSILDSQTKLHSKNAKLSVERDGTIKVENDNRVNIQINSNNDTKDPVSNDKKVDVNSNNQTSVTQTPMYPGYGNGGNRPPYNFGRGNGTNGGYRGGYGGGYYSGNGPRGRGTGYGLHSFDAARDGRSGYMDYLHRGHRGGSPNFARGRGAPRFPRRQQQPNIEQPENLSNRPDENSPVEPNVQENEVSRSTVEPFADTSNANVNHSERFAEDDFDIYSDIESTSASKDENETSPNEATSASFSELMPPPIPPSLPGIVYGSDSDGKDSDTELIIDDVEKTEADKYDPADPSNDTDSEPDTTNTSAVAADNAVASTSTSQPLNMISSLKLTSSEDLRLQPETASSSNVNTNVFPTCSSAIQAGHDEDDDSDEDCPNFSIYSAETMDIAKKTEMAIPVPSLPVEAESSGISADNSQSDEVQQAQSNDLEQVESNDLERVEPNNSEQVESNNLEQVESNNLEQAESNNLEQTPEPDSIQNDEVESSTKDFETENQANMHSEQQEADSVNVQNEPDSNNMEKDLSQNEYTNSNEEMVPLDSTSIPEESGCRSENQSEEISTTQNDTEIDADKVPTESSGTSTSTITHSTDKKVVVAFKPNHHRILQLYDDSDWEEWSSSEKPEGKEKSEEQTDEKLDDSETDKPAEANNSVMAEIEKLTEAVSEEERSYTPCQDENKHDGRKDAGIDGMDTELVSDEEKNDFDENHEMKSDGEALEINAKESELELSVRPEEYEEGEIVEGGKKQKKQEESVTDVILIDNEAIENENKKKKEVSDKKKRDTGDKSKEKKKKVDTSFKKVSKNTKERNYRDKEKERDRSKSKERRGKDGKENKNRKEKRKEKRKELERYDVRNIIGAKVAKKNFADAFGRNESRERSPSLTRHRSLSHGRRSTSRRRKSLSRARRSLSRSRRSFSRRRRSLSRGKRSVSRERRSLSRNKRSLSRTRRGRSRDRRSLSRGRRPRRSKSRSASFRLSRTLSRGRSRSHGRPFNRKSKSKSPRNRNKARHFRSSSRDKSRVRQKSNDRSKLKKSKKKERTSQPRTHNRVSRSLSLTSRNPDPMEWDHQRYRRDWTPSWSRSPSPQLHHAISNVSPSWTPPIHRDNQNLTPQNLTVILTNNEALKKKKEKKKKAEKRAKEQSNDRRKRRRLDKTPPPSKEVFASGDNILVSVKFNKPQNEDGTLTPPVREVIGTKRKRDNMSGEPQKKSKKDKSGKDKRKGEKKKAKNKNKEVSNIKPVAIIDLDKSPFKELTPSPKDVIVLSDSDNGEKEAELMERQEMLREELLEMGSQEEIDSVPQSPRETNYLNATTGPKTPPEPQIKFLIQKPTQLLRNVSNPLHDEHEDNTEIEDMDPQEELEMRLNEVLHKGPNTPPEPPTSPPSSPDAYDPFEPTKSRSPTPELTQPSSPSASIQKCQSIPDAVESDASLADLAVCPLESSQKPSDSTENKTSPLERVVSLLSSKRVSSKSPEHSNRSPTPSQNVDQDNAQKSSSPEKNGEGNTIGVVINQTVQAAPKLITAAPTYSSAAATLITPTPVTQVVSSSRPGGVFSTITAPGIRATSATVPQRSIVLPTSSKSSPIKPPPLKSSPTKVPVKISTPIKPMPKTIISKLPLPATKQYPSNRKMQQPKNTPPKSGGRTTGQNGNDVIDVDLDFDSPYSPGSSDYEDIFEPPPEPFYNTATSRGQTQKNAKKQNSFDTLFGGSPVYKPTPTNKKSKSTATKVPVKYNKKSVSKGGSKNQVGMKLDEDSLKILDDLPSSAVEMQVKDKFLKKLNRQERVVEEVKLVLKPHYNKKHITKEQYKDILRRAVPKICHNKTGEINPKKIQSLIEAYVKRARISNKKSQSSSAPVNSTNTQPKSAAKTFWR